MDAQRLPALFIGHGSPMNTLDDNVFTAEWSRRGAAIAAQHGTPRAILAISAHWYINATAVTAMVQPRTIHDFFGFPPELFAYEYPAPGAPDLVAEIADAAQPTWVGADHDSWGLDHGTWSVLAHMFPHADVPVVQLSIDATKSYAEHVALGARLAVLRERGVLIVASGNVVHNLGRIDWSREFGGYDWADRFDTAARDLIVAAPGEVPRLAEHPDHRAAVPTPDHFMPWLYLAGLASATSETVEPFCEARVLGSLSMTSYALAA